MWKSQPIKVYEIRRKQTDVNGRAFWVTEDQIEHVNKASREKAVEKAQHLKGHIRVFETKKYNR